MRTRSSHTMSRHGRPARITEKRQVTCTSNENLTHSLRPDKWLRHAEIGSPCLRQDTHHKATYDRQPLPLPESGFAHIRGIFQALNDLAASRPGRDLPRSK